MRGERSQGAVGNKNESYFHWIGCFEGGGGDPTTAFPAGGTGRKAGSRECNEEKSRLGPEPQREPAPRGTGAGGGQGDGARRVPAGGEVTLAWVPGMTISSAHT